MHARVSYYELGGASRDDVVKAFEGTRDAVAAMQGNKGATLLLNPQEDRAITITLWESEDALRATEQQADRAREAAASTAAVKITNVERYEVALEFGR